MKTLLLSIISFLFVYTTTIQSQNIPDVNLHFDSRIINCPTTPDIGVDFQLSSADGTVWEVGFIMLTLTVDEFVLGTPPVIVNAPTGWTTDVYKQGSQWQIELLHPNGIGVPIGTSPVDVFSLNWPYIQEGAIYSITIDDADLGVHNSMEDEQMHYPNGLFITGSDDCASQAGEIDFYWSNPVIQNCPSNPTLTTPIIFASHNAGEVWGNSFVQLVIQQDNNIIGPPRIENPIAGWSTDVYLQGNEWVVELSSAVNAPITDAGNHFFDLVWDYLQEGAPYAVTLNDIDLGLNVPNEIIYRPNGNVISGANQCPCSVEIINLQAICSDACESKGRIYFDVNIHNGPGGIFEIIVDGITYSRNLPAGDIILLDESIDDVRVSSPNQQLVARFKNTQCGDLVHIPTVSCGPCQLSMNHIAVGACRASDNTYDVTIDVTAKDLCNGVVFVRIDNGPAVGHIVVHDQIHVAGLSSDGQVHTIEIEDERLGFGCADAGTFTAPVNCRFSSTLDLYGDPIHATLAPNPVLSGRDVEIQADEIIQKLEIYDLSGRQCMMISPGDRSIRITTEGYHSGMYIIVLHTESTTISRKLVVRE